MPLNPDPGLRGFFIFTNMKLDILAFGAHPDDVELSCAGTLAKQVALGSKCGVVDLTQGELGTRGTAEIRLKEAQAAGQIMGLSARENLGFRDGFFTNDEAHQLEVVKMIRSFSFHILISKVSPGITGLAKRPLIALNFFSSLSNIFLSTTLHEIPNEFNPCIMGPLNPLI